jgi:hypothetical protein
MAEQWGIPRQRDVCLVLFAVACWWDASRTLLRPLRGGQGFFSSALCLPTPQIGVSKHETNLVDSSEAFLRPKKWTECRSFKLQKAGVEACLLFLTFGAGRTLFGELVNADNAVLRLGELLWLLTAGTPLVRMVAAKGPDGGVRRGLSWCNILQ